MTKNSKRGFGILAIILVAFCAIAFAAPFSRNAVFGIAFVFGLLAIAFQVYVFKVSFGPSGDAKSKFYGFPIARVGLYYLIIQLIVSIVEMALAKTIPAWAAVVINVVLLALAVIGCISGEMVRDEIVRQDIVLKKDVGNMRALQSMSAALIGQCSDDDTKKALQNMADEFRYSDPVSSNQTAELENNMKRQIEDIQKALIDNDFQAVQALCSETINSLKERNRICSLSK